MIELIKEKPYDKKMDDFMQMECVVCFETFENGTNVRKLPTCHHLFHTKCIDGWFRAKISEAT
jgi:hypothetical protein